MTHLPAQIELVIVGDLASPATEALRHAVYRQSLPNKIVRRLPPDVSLPAHHPAEGKGLIDGKPALYVCQDMSCRAPIVDATKAALI